MTSKTHWYFKTLNLYDFNSFCVKSKDDKTTTSSVNDKRRLTIKNICPSVDTSQERKIFYFVPRKHWRGSVTKEYIQQKFPHIVDQKHFLKNSFRFTGGSNLKNEASKHQPSEKKLSTIEIVTQEVPSDSFVKDPDTTSGPNPKPNDKKQDVEQDSDEPVYPFMPNAFDTFDYFWISPVEGATGTKPQEPVGPSNAIGEEKLNSSTSATNSTGPFFEDVLDDETYENLQLSKGDEMDDSPTDFADFKNPPVGRKAEGSVHSTIFDDDYLKFDKVFWKQNSHYTDEGMYPYELTEDEMLFYPQDMHVYHRSFDRKKTMESNESKPWLTETGFRPAILSYIRKLLGYDRRSTYESP